MKRTVLLFATVFIYTFVQVFPQTPEQITCSTTTTTDPGSNTWGLYKPAQTPNGEYFRVLIVYAQFASDNQQDNVWPLNQLPNWANSIIATNVSTSYPQQTLSDYFYQASLGKFNFIGDVYQNLIIVPTNMSYGAANQYVIGQLNNNITNFSRYDNWKVVNGNFVFSPGSADGYLDMLIIIYRNVPFTSPYFGIGGGIANLNISDFTTHDGITINGGTSTIGSGITTRAGLSGEFNIVGNLSHEYSHYLFGGGHTSLGGLMMGDPYPYLGSYMMNAWERAKLGYITPIIPTTDGQQITLGDFVTTGDAIKIPIPFNNPSSTTYFLVENHQRASIYDQIMRGGSLNGNYNLTTTLGSGIYVWIITGGDSYPPNIDIKSADGAWDWQYVGDYYAGPGWNVGQPYAGYVPETIRSAVDRNAGKSDRWPYNIFWNNSWASKWVDTDPLTGQWELTRNCMGDSTDPFNIGYNELLTPWSNPSSYLNGTTNISMELINSNTLKIFSTSASALALPPSKPQNLHFTYQSQNNPTMAWDANTEPDLYKYVIYREYDNDGNWFVAGTVYPPTTSFTDYNVTFTKPVWNKSVIYKMQAVDNSSLSSVYSDAIETQGYMSAPPKISTGSSDYLSTSKNYTNINYLSQSYPNPFNPTTMIFYTLKERDYVTLVVFDVLGKEVARLVDGIQTEGEHSVNFDGSNLPSGMYIYQLKGSNFNINKKMLLLK